MVPILSYWQDFFFSVEDIAAEKWAEKDTGHGM